MANYRIVRDTDGNVTMVDVVNPPANRRSRPKMNRAEVLADKKRARKNIGKSIPDKLVESHENLDPETYACQHCDFTTLRPTALKSHIRFKHPEPEEG